MRHATRGTLFFSLLCVAGVGVAVGCHDAAGRPPVQTERVPVVGGSLREESFLPPAAARRQGWDDARVNS